ncbi:hypothetical protein [Phyllobacterium endophyticum]|uniref:hypothetical protein n=1 Tax=Phyllobacterium endophyticum TaxID=1149773 RepID=UPI001AEDA67B|nr:hypothetical protein [Phyllobacterium endophyticum]
MPLSAYAGTYFNPYIGKAVVAEKDGTLESRLGPEGKAVSRSAILTDLYTYRPSAEMPNMPVRSHSKSDQTERRCRSRSTT